MEYENRPNELTTQQSASLIAALDGHGIGDMLKPLVREIHLFDSYVAGTAHLKDPAVLDTLRPGDKLTLLREENKFDDNAILLITENKLKIGYVPEKDNIIFARLMDAGKLLAAKINDIETQGSFRKISIGIYMVDF